MTRWSEADFARVSAKLKADPVPYAPKPRKKYGNTKVIWQGQKFDSGHELKKFQEYELERIAGTLRGVVRQVSLPLPGSKRRIRIDLMLVSYDGRIRFVDPKGYETEAWRLKRDIVAQAYGIDIELV